MRDWGMTVRKLFAGVLATLVAGFCLSAVALGQGAGGEQYTPTTGVDSTPTSPPATPAPTTPAADTPTTPTTPVADDGGPTTGSDDDQDVAGENETRGSGDGDAKPDRGRDGSTGSANRGSGAQSDGITGFPGNRVAVLNWGTSSDELEADIEEALRRAGLQSLSYGNATAKSLKAFLASDEAEALASDGPRAVGKAFGSQIVNVTPTAIAAFPVLFGPDDVFMPVIRAVLTRRAGISDDAAEMLRGVAEGLESTGVPVAYVEISDTKPTFVEEYEKLKVPVVDDIDTDKGKLELGRIMLGEGTTSRKVTPDNASALGDAPSADGGVPVGSIAVVLAFLACVGLFFANQGRRRSRR